MQDLPTPDDLAARDPQSYPNESAEYRAARTKLLASEIALRRRLEAVAAERRALPPGGEVGAYRFEGADGETDMAGLFGDKDTLIVYSWMFGPERDQPCPMCTTLLDAWDGNAKAIGERAALAITGRSPIARQLSVARERGWERLRFFCDPTGDFTRDYHGLAGATPGDKGENEIPAFNVFTRHDGTVRHFYGGEMTGPTADPGQDPRGAPDLMPLWNILDMTPEGRGTKWHPTLEMH